MKKMLMMVVVVLMMGCNLKTIDDRCDEYYSDLIKKSDLYYGDFSSIHNVYDISIYILSNIEYIPDDKEEWATTENTLLRGYGDCDDMAIVFINILYVKFNIKADIICVSVRSIENGGLVNHAMARLPDGTTVDPRTGAQLQYPVGYSYSFDEFFNY